MKLHWPKAFILSLSLFSNLVVLSQTQDPIHLSSISTDGALLYEPTSVFVVGNYAYVTSYINDALDILDITNPAVPVHKGSLVTGKGGAQLHSPSSIFVSGNYAYVGSLSALEIVDISDPANPTHKGSIATSPTGGLLFGQNSVFVSGNYAYVASREDNSLSIVDVSDPAAPFIKGSISDGAGGALLKYPSSVKVTGNYAYVVSQLSNSLEVVDISNPATPVHKGSIVDGSGGAVMNYPYSVYVSGSYAYVASFSSSSLEIIDISNPASPAHKGNIVHNPIGTGALLAGPRSVVVSGNYAFVASDPNSLEIVDVTNPSLPQHKGNIASSDLNGPFSVFVSGNYAYVASALSSRLGVIDISNPVTPAIVGGISDGVGRTNQLVAPQSIFVSGNYAYVASQFSNTLEILDVADLTNPVHKGSISDGNGGAMLNFPYSVFVSGNYAYVVSRRSHALEIIDISNPSAPVHKSSIVNGVGGALLSNPVSVFVSGNYAYVASMDSNALEIIDISNPANPLHKGSLTDGNGSIPFLNSPSSVSVAGNYAYVASTGSNTLEVVDVSDPTTPVHKGYIKDGNGSSPFLNRPIYVFIQGNIAYVAASASGAVEIIDISNPALPVRKGGSGPGGFQDLTSVFVSGSRAYVTTGHPQFYGASLTVLDVSDPVSPVQVGAIADGHNSAMLDNPTSVFVSGATLFVTSYNGVEILAAPLPPPIAISASAISTGGFTASWSPVSGAASYQLDVSADNFATYVSNYNSASVSGASHVVTGLNPGTYYSYRVRAVGTSTTSISSNVVFTTTLPLAPVAIDASGLTAGGFTANWNFSYGASGYQIDITTDNFSSFVDGFNSLAVTGSSKVVTGLAVGKYQYRVRAVDASGASVSSNVVSVCVNPAAPTISGPGASNPTQLVLTSNASSGIQWYLNGNGISGATNSSYVIAAPGDYTMKVTQAGCSSTSNVIHISVVTGEISSIGEINVFPNPANDNISISLNGRDASTIKIYDMKGQVVNLPMENENGILHCDIRSLSTGVYILKVVGKGEERDIKFVKR